jgi:trimethylamine--corrinoid protein Co-methyltransferase
MHAAGHAYNPMSAVEVELVHRSALRILDEVGMEVQNRRILDALAEFGLSVDLESQRVRFPPTMVERVIDEAEKHDWENAPPCVESSAGVYHSLYHDPVSGELLPWTEESLASYFALAHHLPHVEGACMLGCRLPVPEPLAPLYERYYCWKLGATEGGSIHLDELCPYLLELYEIRADERGLPASRLFNAAVYLVPPLKLARHAAYQVAYFWERGLRVSIGDMYAMGATAPVTLAGAVTLNLAEQLALHALNRVLFGEKKLALGGSISPMDMRTTAYTFGRPERAIANLMTAQLARHYGARFFGHAGLTDAKLPSAEAGAQKALSAIPTLLAGGRLWLDAGLLSTDEICSPVQMTLDNELVGALNRFAREFEVTDETIGLDTIIEAGPGGHYIDRHHTARHFRNDLWEPAIWSRRTLRPWQEEGSHHDADRAREVALEVQRRGVEPDGMTQEMERRVLRVIDRARRELL